MIRIKDIENIIMDSGAAAFAVVKAAPVENKHLESLDLWLARNHNASMQYMANHRNLRADPAGLLEGAMSVICIAFSYAQPRRRNPVLPRIAEYAYGMDYHDALRNRLQIAANRLSERFGGQHRICIDSAPMLERYWAEKSGLGFRCDNGLIAVPDFGTKVFLAEILTTLEIENSQCPNEDNDNKSPESVASHGSDSSSRQCLHCGRCRSACPAAALQPDSTVDSRRCLSYLTIEHRGQWDEIGESAMHTPAGHATLFGCDICQKVCPLNQTPPAPDALIEEFMPRPEILSINANDILVMEQTEFSRIFKGSPIKRTKLDGLRRNAANIEKIP